MMINNFFNEILIDVNCQEDTRAYIVSIYDKFKDSRHDLSKNSITLLFCQARDKRDFLIYQNIGDYIFWHYTIFDATIFKDYYDNLARLSYYNCYNIINKQWKLYEELADQFLTLEEQVKKRIRGI